jgi:hypothetical protein
MTDPTNLSRRDFLGFLGIVLLGPAVNPAAGEQDEGPGGGPVYLGPVRDLAAGVPLKPCWDLEFDALIESVDTPPSEWLLSEVSATFLEALFPLTELPARLRSRGIRRACEATYRSRTDGMPSVSHLADVTIFENIRRCAAAWRDIEKMADEAGLVSCESVGDAAVVSRDGKRFLPGKLFFRRGNVLASVVPWTPDRDATPFAAVLDSRIVDLSH